MSLNDFEYVDDLNLSMETGAVELLEINMTKVITDKQEVHKSIDSLIDSAGEAWFTLGEKLAERKFNDILDKLENTLLDSEEDAKMTIHLIRKMVENYERE